MQYCPNRHRGIKKLILNINCFVRVANKYPSNLFIRKHGMYRPHRFNQTLLGG